MSILSPPTRGIEGAYLKHDVVPRAVSAAVRMLTST